MITPNGAVMPHESLDWGQVCVETSPKAFAHSCREAMANPCAACAENTSFAHRLNDNQFFCFHQDLPLSISLVFHHDFLMAL